MSVYSQIHVPSPVLSLSSVHNLINCIILLCWIMLQSVLCAGNCNYHYQCVICESNKKVSHFCIKLQCIKLTFDSSINVCCITVVLLLICLFLYIFLSSKDVCLFRCLL